MGKKSKRQRGNRSSSSTSREQRPRGTGGGFDSKKKKDEVETKENLLFEDPYVDEIIQEDVVYNNEDDDDMEEDYEGEERKGELNDESPNQPLGGRPTMNIAGDDVELIQSWHPLMGRPRGANGDEVEEQLELEMDPSAYKMYQTLTPEWPCLSFDLLRDNLGENRQRFPHSLQAVIGTQADNPDANQLTVLKISDLSKLSQDKANGDEEDIFGEEYDNQDDDDSDEEDLDLDPILEHYSLPHYGCVNRVRAMPQNQSIVATWSDVGKVNLYNIEELRERFEASEGRGGGRPTTLNSNLKNDLFFSYDGHTTEGFAVDWSTISRGSLATGDNDGNIHLWTCEDGGRATSGYTVTPSYETPEANVSIEDIQWSPSESTVFCAGESNGHVAIYDTRAPGRAMLRPQLHPNTDVNVLSWNKLVTNLLATGGDDGTLCVWDLRQFGSGSKNSSTDGTPDPLARFTCHQTPITSVEWHPTDESMLAISDEVGVYVYDLSVEEDIAVKTSSATKQHNEMQQLVADIPPQLLFCHSGSIQFKECHWHPQISSCVMTTAYSGFSVFIPSNL